MNVDGETVSFAYNPTPPGGRFEHGFWELDGTSDQLLGFDGQTFLLSWPRAAGGHGHSAHDGDILSPMPGKIIAVEVSAGQAVTKGQKLLTLEAMKMEHTLTAPFDGVVAELSAVAGAQVQVEALLARIEQSIEAAE